jgi:hypothetical protein
MSMTPQGSHRTFCSRPLATLCALLATVLLTLPAGALPVDVSVNGEVVGTVNAAIEASGADEGVRGGFEVSKTNPDGSVMSLAELERFLGQDHLNWFQKVTRVEPDDPAIADPFIDPPSGGFGTQWADDRPWYWDEFRPVPVPDGKVVGDAFQLSNRAHGSTLDYFDFPGGQANGTEVDFVTCLISDYGNRKYHVLGGCFGWSITITAAGDTDVTSLANGSWSNEFEREVRDEFGFRLPLPSGLILVALGAVAMGAAARRRTRTP